MIFVAGADKLQFGTLVEDLNNSYLAENDQYPVVLDSTLTCCLITMVTKVVNTWTMARVYQGRQVLPSANRKKCSNLRGFVAAITMNMATIRVIVPKRRSCMKPKCQKLKKMRTKMGLQALHLTKMGLQVLNPAQGCNCQVTPRFTGGNENRECSNSAFFQREK
jgi:hypothetical protein